MTPLLALLLAAAPPAPVGEWVPFDVPQERGSARYDSGTVQRSGDRVQAWVRWIPDGQAADVHEVRLLSEIDCRARTGRIVLTATYDREGTLTGSVDGSTAEQAIRTGYMAHGIELALCGRS